MQITTAQLRAIAGGKAPLAEKIVGPINKYADQYGVDTPLRMAHFLGHAAVETAWFSRLEENLSYSAQRMTEVWPSRFKSIAAAQPYARKPQLLANKVYGGRLGNNNDNDGWLYRGSGLFQTTGKTNFAAVERATGLPVIAQPELLRDPDTAVQSAMIYFKARVADDADRDDATASRKAVNGGAHGLADFKNALARAKKALAVPSTEKPVVSRKPRPVQAAAIMPARPAESVREADPEIPAEYLKAMQRQFHKIGYGAEVGLVDGKWGGKATAAFSAFQQDNGLPVTGRPDDKTVEMLFAAKENSRPIAKERQEIKAADIKAGSPIVQSTSSMKSTSLIGGIGASATLAYNAVIGYAGDAWDYLKDFRDAFSEIPTWAWIAGVVVVAIYFHQKADKAEKARVEAERRGLITTTPENQEKV